MKIKVEYKSEVLGDGVVWEGDSKNINQIINIPARQLAYRVAKDGVSRKVGMWIVTADKETT